MPTFRLALGSIPGPHHSHLSHLAARIACRTFGHRTLCEPVQPKLAAVADAVRSVGLTQRPGSSIGGQNWMRRDYALGLSPPITDLRANIHVGGENCMERPEMAPI